MTTRQKRNTAYAKKEIVPGDAESLRGAAIEEFLGRAKFIRGKGNSLALREVAWAIEGCARFLHCWGIAAQVVCPECEGMGVRTASCEACNKTGYEWPGSRNA